MVSRSVWEWLAVGESVAVIVVDRGRCVGRSVGRRRLVVGGVAESDLSAVGNHKDGDVEGVVRTVARWVAAKVRRPHWSDRVGIMEVAL